MRIIKSEHCDWISISSQIVIDDHLCLLRAGKLLNQINVKNEAKWFNTTCRKVRKTIANFAKSNACKCGLLSLISLLHDTCTLLCDYRVRRHLTVNRRRAVVRTLPRKITKKNIQTSHYRDSYGNLWCIIVTRLLLVHWIGCHATTNSMQPKLLCRKQEKIAGASMP